MKRILPILSLAAAMLLSGCNVFGGNDNKASSSSGENTQESSGSSSENQTVTLKSITLDTTNVNKNFYVGDTFSYAGLVVTAKYSNDSSKVVTNYSVSTPNMATTGQKTVTVSYTEGGITRTASYSINVGNNPSTLTLKSITLNTTSVKKSFYLGEPFTSEGLVVTAKYSNNSTKTVTGFIVTPPDMSVPGSSKTVNVSYTENGVTKSSSYTITVVGLASISVSGGTRKFNLNDTFSYEGLVVTASYSNGTSHAVTGYKVSTPDMSVAGKQSVTVTYSESGINASTSYTISIIDPDATPVNETYTVMIYLCGADLESQYGQASSNLIEILSLKSQIPEEVNIIVETGGAKSWMNSELQKVQPGLTISSSYLQRWKIDSTGMHQLGSNITYASMGAQSTFQNFFEWGIENYSADQMGLIMWNHGGAMSGCCQDEKKDDILSPFELDAALSSAFSKKGLTDNLTWIGYDCCLMGVADIAAYNSNYFNYMVGSQETEPGGGWDYDGWMDDLFDDPSIDPEDLLSEVCDTYSQKCEDDYVAYVEELTEYASDSSNFPYQGWYGDAVDEDGYSAQDYLDEAAKYIDYNDATLAVYDLTKIESFKSGLNTLVSDLTSAGAKSSFKSNVINKALTFQSGYYVYDALDVANRAKTKYGVSITAFTNALNEFIVHNATGKTYTKNGTIPCGVCLYTGSISSTSYRVLSSWYSFVH